MNNYQDYVIKDGKFIGKFDKMYQDCQDPWLQDKVLHKSNEIVLGFLSKNKKINKLLDVGCGKGNYTNLIYENICQDIDAIDISETAIHIARQRYDYINFIADDIITTDKLKTGYDLIIVSQLLWYILENLEKLFEKIKFLAATDARIIFIQTYYPPSVQKYGKDIMAKAEDLVEIIPFSVENIIDVKNFEEREWKDTESIIVCRKI